MVVVNETAETKRLFDAGAHFAQVRSRRHPSMKPFLVGARGRIEIIDLSQTVEQLVVACAAMEHFAKEGKTVLFVGGKAEIAALVKQAANSISAPYVATRWLGGTISNWPEIKKRIDRLTELSGEAPTGTRAKQHTKLELVHIEREREQLAKKLDGITTLAKRPDVLVVVDTRHERHAMKEANDAGIPVIAIMSSDCNVAEVVYPIVANDASREAVRLILTELVSAFQKGQAA